MDFDDFIKILSAFCTLTIGAFLTAVRGKISSLNEKNTLHYIFYVFSFAVLIGSLISIRIYWTELSKPNYAGIVIIFLCIVASILLIWFTNKFLVGKYEYKISDLNTIVNKFTTNADKADIRLFGGDLNFFGNAPHDMNGNSQYTTLRAAGYRKIEILCEEPTDNTDKIRYGKIVMELQGVELRFYKPQTADLKIRGRMNKLNGIIQLLIYIKISEGIYKPIHTHTSNYDGALYDNVWKLAWSLARNPEHNEIEEYKNLFSR